MYIFVAALPRAFVVKIGKELFIEATADQLVLRTLNDAKSAFSAFYFNDEGGFFETFRHVSEGEGGRGCCDVRTHVLISRSAVLFRCSKKCPRLCLVLELWMETLDPEEERAAYTKMLNIFLKSKA